MPDVITIRVDGLRELGEALRKLDADLQQKYARQATGAAASVVKRKVKQLLRSNPTVDTGLLEQNVIAKRVPKSKTQLTSEHAVVVRKRDYPKQRGKSRRNTRQVALYMEYGTVKMPKGEPFIKPGFELSKGAALEALISKLKQRLG